MPYIGRGTDKLSNVEVLDNITFDGSSSYTLQKGGSNFTPSSANTLLVSIDGVVQAGNFTVSGSTIDFGTAVAGTSTCDFILHYGVGLITTPSDGTVTTAKLADSSVSTAKLQDSSVTTAKLNDASVSLAKLTATGTKDATTFLRGDNTFAEAGGGITEADMFRLTANVNSNGDITSNLERIDTDFDKIGTGMTESSGIFTFPSTGIYYVAITALFQYTNQADNATQLYIYVTTNNSTYNERARAVAGSNSSSGNSQFSVFNSTFVDVTDTSNVKVKFGAASFEALSTLEGETDKNRTTFTFIRLGDT